MEGLAAVASEVAAVSAGAVASAAGEVMEEWVVAASAEEEVTWGGES